MKLWEIAHSRTGGKGNISNVSLIAYDAKDFEMLKEKVTAEKVKEHFKGIVKGEVVRYELPNICALNFVMYAALRTLGRWLPSVRSRAGINSPWCMSRHKKADLKIASLPMVDDMGIEPTTSALRTLRSPTRNGYMRHK